MEKFGQSMEPLILILSGSYTCFAIPKGTGQRFHMSKILWLSEMTLSYELPVNYKNVPRKKNNFTLAGLAQYRPAN